MNRQMEKDFNMKIDKQKTKILVCIVYRVDRIRIKLKNEIIQEVKECNYLGSKITNDGRHCREIVNRINQAKADLIRSETYSLQGRSVGEK